MSLIPSTTVTPLTVTDNRKISGDNARGSISGFYKSYYDGRSICTIGDLHLKEAGDTAISTNMLHLAGKTYEYLITRPPEITSTCQKLELKICFSLGGKNPVFTSVLVYSKGQLPQTGLKVKKSLPAFLKATLLMGRQRASSCSSVDPQHLTINGEFHLTIKPSNSEDIAELELTFTNSNEPLS